MKDNNKPFVLVLLAFIFLKVVGCDETNPTNPPEEEMFGTQIMFQSNRDSTVEIYIMNPDGSRQTRITNNNTKESEVKYSNSQDIIIFNDYKEKDIFTIAKNGTSLNNIMNTPRVVENITDISVDGEMVLLMMERDMMNFDAFVFKVGDTKLIKLVVTSDSLSCFNPKFSPDGTKIVFQTHRLNVESSIIAMMDINGQNFNYISGDPSQSDFHYDPMFTPDGNYVIYRRLDNFHVVDLSTFNTKIIEINGGRLVGRYNRLEDISSNGNVVLFSSFRNDKTNLFSINIDGSNEIQLTIDGGSNGKFSPDNSHVIYNSAQIYRVDLDGKNVTALTSKGGWNPQYIPGYNENE
ncbi:MAG: PD40 domain-containing protein [Candidatus Marinimicrobia bacterium]|nr:PD40 domain-containing protein [Candidatus Neomarinimicrobiota bacterium]MBL7011004.1 PD40 domain-containing protein [Candidatus Neomarinimicrobiota bacterium]MBL7031328.1 PD40 domain-containing protein [Candidatus Neomarinimicrobiota bacterium]